jgi:hypothetical protein
MALLGKTFSHKPAPRVAPRRPLIGKRRVLQQTPYLVRGPQVSLCSATGDLGNRG